MNGKNITIIGIGNIGIILASLLAYRTQWDPNCIDKLTLIDPDILEEKNLPYGFYNNNYKYKKFINYPKIYAAEEILHDINKNLDIYSTRSKFPECLPLIDDSSIVIDCRDSPDKHERCFIKICSDGPYSRIVFNPKNDIENKNSDYIIGSSKYHSILTISKVIEVLFYNEDEYEYSDGTEKTYIIDFINNKGEMYVLNDKIG